MIFGGTRWLDSFPIMTHLPCFPKLNKAASIISPEWDLNPPVVVGLPPIQALHQEKSTCMYLFQYFATVRLQSCQFCTIYTLKSTRGSSATTILVFRYSEAFTPPAPFQTLTFFSSIALSRKFRSLLDSGVSLILVHSLPVVLWYLFHD